MARVTHVKKAQQRYKTVPVIDEATGKPKRTPVMNKRTGEQKVSKKGPVWMTVTQADKSQPLPELSCDFPGCDINGGKIAVGTPYKHITPKSGPYGGTQKNRHAEHPSWNVWEYSSSLSARVAQVQNDMEEAITNAEFTESGDFESVKDEIEQMAQDLLDEKQESLDNMPEGLAEGSMLQEQVEALESWVEAIADADEPEFPEPEPVTRYFVMSDGMPANEDDDEGFESEEDAQADIDAYYAKYPDADPDEMSIEEREVTPEEPSDEEIDAWADECRDALRDAISECEV